ncbi:MAG: PilZ domain-containing protein [Lachnospiraceae bacterium]|nr:PilZ domain-containing protein [Lachnospiraceae bacterium]
MDGFEKRRSKRMNIDLKLNISNLFKQDNVVIANIDAPIQVTDISKGGIGFNSNATLPIGYYFNACIILGAEDSQFYTVVRIIRSALTSDGTSTHYGAEFIGKAEILDYIFDEYELSVEQPS